MFSTLYLGYFKAYYCGEACQNEDWAKHETYCRNRRRKQKREEKSKKKDGGEGDGVEDGGEGDGAEDGGDGEEKDGVVEAGCSERMKDLKLT